MFGGLRTNAIIYILDKGGERPQLRTGQVVSVSNPKPLYQTTTGGAPLQPFGTQLQEMTVDIKAKAGDESFDFNNLPTQGVLDTCGGLIVSDSREAMCAEVEAMQRASAGVVESVDYHREVIRACEAMQEVLNPQFAKDREQERKIGQLEDKVTGMEGTLTEIKDMLVRTLKRKE